MISPDSRLTFGKHKGMALRQCPGAYLQWMTKSLRDSDFHEWAVAAEKALKDKPIEERNGRSLEDNADDFLRKHGIDPKKL